MEAPPTPDYVSGLKEPEQAPPLPEFVLEIVYPMFMPLKDEILLAEEQPLPADDLPTIVGLYNVLILCKLIMFSFGVDAAEDFKENTLRD
nr:hypothetical protein [Tanacetum cinerariifolium]